MRAVRTAPWVPGSLAPLLVSLLLLPSPGTAQKVGKEAIRELTFRELAFEPPRAQTKTLSSGVSVFFLEDHTLPLVTLYARFRGGYALLPRSSYAAAVALPGLLRTGGTASLPPDSVDYLSDFYALQMSFGGGGQSTFSSINTLTKHLEPALALWSDLLRNPAFDSLEVEVWRDRQLERARRKGENPGLLAVSEFNRIMFGDHPVGWDLTEGDLTPERMSPQAVTRVHARVVCPQNLILGVVGDTDWSGIRPLLEEMLEGWAPCSEPLMEPRTPDLREGPALFLIPKELTQSTIVMAKPGGISQGTDAEYFASKIGNAVLGASGFTSRLLSRLRTEMGYTYSASSFWTTPSRSQGIVGATTHTKSESTVAVIRLIQEIIQDMSRAPPEPAEVEQIISQIVNSFIFNFQDPSQIVSRQMFYRAQDLPEDWLERYVRGVQDVSPEAIQEVFQRYVDPREMVILIVGDPEAFDEPPEVLGDVQLWEVGG